MLIGLVITSVFAIIMGLGYFTGAFTNLYYTWTENNQELRAFLQHDLGERLNLESESNGIKIKIKGAVADDVQTLVFYEIEDTNEENQYMINYDDGILMENELGVINRVTYPVYYPPDLKSDLNKKEKNVYQGKISLPPLKMNKGAFKLKITKLQKLIHDPSAQNGFMTEGNNESETGEWNFKIPITKQPLTEYVLKKKTEVEGIPVQFDKLTIAPTVNDPKIIELNASQKYPQTFEYASSTISIDKVEDGQMTNFVISNHEIKLRIENMRRFNLVL